MELIIDLSCTDHYTPWHLCRRCKHSTHCVLNGNKYQDRVAGILTSASSEYLRRPYRIETFNGIQIELDLVIGRLPCAELKQLSAKVVTQ